MAGDPYWNSVVLAMHMDGTNGSTTFTDQKGNTVTASGNAQISTAQFAPLNGNGSSALFDGSGDYLTIPTSTSFDVGSGDFCIEFWLRSTGGWSGLVSRDAGTFATAGNWYLYMQSGYVAFFPISYSSGAPLLTSSGVTVNNGAWHHVALVRNGSNWVIADDGISRASATWSGAMATTTNGLRVGNDATQAGDDFSGNIDDLRFTKGFARYTSFPFTPPAAPFPNNMAQVAGTVKDSTGAFAARTIRAYRRSDGLLAGSATSNGTTGAFAIDALDSTPHYALALDSASENALILDNITPV